MASGEENEKSGKEHLKESGKHLGKGAQKAIDDAVDEERIEELSETFDRKMKYYDQRKSQLLGKASYAIGASKAPAASGLIVLLPLFTVYLVIEWLFGKINQIPGIENITVNGFLGLEFSATVTYYASQSYRLAVLLILGAVTVTAAGKAVNTKKGFKAERIIDHVFEKIPFIGSVYSITKVTTETVLGSAEDFSKPVKIEHNGFRFSGFKTGNKAEDGREIVFVPTAPNITSGAVVEIEEEKLVESDEDAEQALTRVLSAGFGQSNKDREEK
ncbi:DUF502 domain-containing protein [Candidatus Nanohalococcus occultus]|uniref:Membrane protein n=1 Tax=Candidatus Nanohalococcus occultus TaxID=2978047 RepID=A0ABY8CFH0_9ARCH|nr:putative membrane protein [Candidatus Nanohaloarchaeota archaeon SVXNc]